MSINLTATNHLLELITTGAGAVHVAVSFIDDNSGTKTGGSQTTIISSATTTTIVSAPGASVQRSVHHINIQAVAGNTITVQKDVAATDHVLIGPITLTAAERLEFTASAGWKKTNSSGLNVVSFPAIADDTFPANTSGTTNTPSAKTFTSLAGTGLTYNATTHALDTTGVSVPSISDQRVLGNDSGVAATPTATTVHQVLDWIGGEEQWLFDGTNDFVDFGNVHAFERTQAFTLSIWTNSSFYFGKSLPISINSNQRGYAFQLNSGGNIAVRLNNNIAAGGTAALVINSTSTVTVTENTHFVLTYDGSSASSGVTVYVNGASVALTAVSSSVTATIVGAAHLCIGGKEDGVGTTGGIQHNAAIWTSELTGAEVLEVYNSGAPPDLNALPTAPAPEFWVKMDEDDATGAGGIIDHGTGGNDGTAQNGLAPGSALGNLPVRGSATWQLVAPGASGTALTSNGVAALPSFRQIGLNGLPSMAAGTVLTNVTAGSATPTAHAWSTLAGDGLTYTNVTGILAVGSSTSIVVNANDVQRAALTGAITAAANVNTTAFGALAAKSVLANATNASAVPAALAGSAAFQHLRVNSANNALEWAVLSLSAFPAMAAGSFLANVTAGSAVPTAHDLATFAGAGLTYTNVTGIMAVGAGTGITVNANDVQLTTIADDTFMANVSGGAAVATGKTFSSLAGDSLSYDATGHNIDYVGTSNDVPLNAITGAQGVVDISTLVCGGRVAITAPTGAWSIDGFTAKTEGFWFVLTAASTDFPGTIINSTTANTGIRNPGFVNFTCNRQMSGLVMYGAFGGNSQWLFIPGALDPAELGFQAKKPVEVCRWDDDFDYVVGSSFSGNMFTGRGVWYSFNAGSAGGSTAFLAGESGHPGIVRLTTHTVIDNLQCIHRGSSTSVLPTFPWVIGSDIREMNVVCRLDTGNNVGLFIGFSEDPSNFAITGTGNSHIMGFLHDTAGAISDSSVHCITRESDGSATDTDSGVTPGSDWRKYTIRQYTVGTVEFLINDALVATHSTQVPDTEGMNFGISVITRSAAARILDIDYADFESHRLARF